MLAVDRKEGHAWHESSEDTDLNVPTMQKLQKPVIGEYASPAGQTHDPLTSCKLFTHVQLSERVEPICFVVVSDIEHVEHASSDALGLKLPSPQGKHVSVEDE